MSQLSPFLAGYFNGGDMAQNVFATIQRERIAREELERRRLADEQGFIIDQQRNARDANRDQVQADWYRAQTTNLTADNARADEAASVKRAMNTAAQRYNLGEYQRLSPPQPFAGMAGAADQFAGSAAFGGMPPDAQAAEIDRLRSEGQKAARAAMARRRYDSVNKEIQARESILSDPTKTSGTPNDMVYRQTMEQLYPLYQERAVLDSVVKESDYGVKPSTYGQIYSQTMPSGTAQLRAATGGNDPYNTATIIGKRADAERDVTLLESAKPMVNSEGAITYAVPNVRDPRNPLSLPPDEYQAALAGARARLQTLSRISQSVGQPGAAGPAAQPGMDPDRDGDASGSDIDQDEIEREILRQKLNLQPQQR